MKDLYTDKEDEWLKEHINDCKWDELTERFDTEFGKARTKTALKKHCRDVLHIVSNRIGDFPKGNVPHNVKSVGTEKWENGYLWVKVNDVKGKHGSHEAFRLNWKPKHILIWEKTHGKVPKGKQIVFLDGNRTNFELDNLYCTDTGVIAVMNRYKWFTDNRDNTLTAIKWCELYFTLKGE